MSRASVIIRADATSAIGMGHVMRCFALAQMLVKRGVAPIFVSNIDSPQLVERIRADGIDVRRVNVTAGSPDDVAFTVDIASRSNAEWVVVDGSGFGAFYDKALKDSGQKVLRIDDAGELPFYYADIILNQNLHANTDMYMGKHISTTRLLLGNRYIMLRREFIEADDVGDRKTEGKYNILVTLGGADPENMTSKVLEALNLIGNALDISVTVVVGGCNQHVDDIKAKADVMNLPVKVIYATSSMRELIVAADLAVCSGGTTVWELAYLGVPAVVGQIADVEDLLVAGLKRTGLFVTSGWFRDTSVEAWAATIKAVLERPALREEMSKKAREFVDGLGTLRIIDAMCLA